MARRVIDADNMPDFLSRMRDRADDPLHGFGRWQGTFRDWQAQGLTLLHEAVGPVLQGNAEAEVIASDTSDGGAILRQRLLFRFPTGAEAQALMLLPAGPGPHPAVLLLHDHGSEFGIGKEKIIAPWHDPPAEAASTAWRARFYDGASLGHALAARGYAVLSADALGWGSRQGNGYEAQQALAANLMQLGLTHAGLIAAEDAQLARWLSEHPAVDAARVGALGFSFGGYRAWQVAALAPQVAAAVAAGWMGRLTDLMRPGSNQLRGQSAFTMLHPVLGGQLDYPDVAGLAAPKPLLFLSGRSDRHFPPDVTGPAFAVLRRIWAAAGQPERLEVAPPDDSGHVFTTAQQSRAIAFLDRTLS